MNRHFIVAVDFDGTIVEHRFPNIGPPVPYAVQWLKEFQQQGAKLILWTMRSCEGDRPDCLTNAVDYCRALGIEFWGVNENPQQKADRWTTSPKVYAHVYVDDSAAGTPLIKPASNVLPYVDWSLVGPHVMNLLSFHNKMNDIRTGGFNTGPHVELPKAMLVNP